MVRCEVKPTNADGFAFLFLGARCLWSHIVSMLGGLIHLNRALVIHQG